MLIDKDTVLTAAHCLYSTDGTQYDFSAGGNATGYVCTGENIQSGAECSSIATMRRPGGFTPPGSSTREYDYALLNIEDEIGRSNYMAISTAADADIELETMYTTGSPGYFPSTCTLNNPRRVTAVDSTRDTAYAYGQSVSEVTDLGSLWGTTFDATTGQSGAGIYYFPGAGTTTAHYVAAVLASFREQVGDDYVIGPKASDFRTWVVANRK